MQTITIQLPTETSYWGSVATESDVDRILTNLEEMISSQFGGGEFDLRFERTPTPRGSGVHGDDLDACDRIHSWIQEKWQMAL